VIFDQLQDLFLALHRIGQGQVDHFDSPASSQMLPADHAPAVLVVGGEDLVARLQVEPLGDHVHALGGIARHGDFVRGGIEKLGRPGRHLIPGSKAVVHRVAFELAHAGANRVDHHAGRGSHAATVEVDQAGIEEELLTNAFPQGLLCRKGLNIVLQVFELVGKGAGYFGQDAGCRQRGGQGFYKGASFHRVCVIINIDNAHSADKKRQVRLGGK